MENRERLAIDLDGVVYPFISAVETYCRVNCDYKGTLYEFYKDANSLMKYYGVEWLVDSPDIYYKIFPDKKMMQLLNKLSEKFQLFYITARPANTLRVTEKYLKDFNFPQRNNLIFSPDKATYARLLGMDYFIEDSAENANKIAKTCVSFLLNQPYNRGIEGNFTRLESIYELEGLLL